MCQSMHDIYKRSWTTRKPNCISSQTSSNNVFTYPCIGGSLVNSFGRHDLSCNKHRGRLSRHGEIDDFIKRVIVSGGVPAIHKPRQWETIGWSTLIPWSDGQQLMWALTCGTQLQQRITFISFCMLIPLFICIYRLPVCSSVMQLNILYAFCSILSPTYKTV